MKKALDFGHVPLTEDKRRDPAHVPYYLRNFQGVLRGVLEETDDGRLFLEEELAVVDVFRHQLSLDAQKLYVRLFQRKFDWIQDAKKYDEVLDPEEALSSLCQRGFLRDQTDLDDLEAVLGLLAAPSLKKLCKDFNQKPNGSQKSELIQTLKLHAKKKVFSFHVGQDSNLLQNKILQR